MYPLSQWTISTVDGFVSGQVTMPTTTGNEKQLAAFNQPQLYVRMGASVRHSEAPNDPASNSIMHRCNDM